MKKRFIVHALLLISTASFAQLVHISGDKFSDNDNLINYPCMAGGHPLVIYSAPVNNSTPIFSALPIEPLYVEPGYSAGPLQIDQASASDQSSLTSLIINSPNPANSFNYVKFGVHRSKPFYINSINFANIDVTAEDHYVSSAKILLNDTLYEATATPSVIHDYDQSWVFPIGKYAKKIEGQQYSWNQLGQWAGADTQGKWPTYPVKYSFRAELREDGSNTYNGYGFWVCGSDTQQQ